MEPLRLVPMEPPRSNDYCFLCLYGGSDSTEAQSLVTSLRELISHSLHKRNMNDIVADAQAYYDKNIRNHVPERPHWTQESIRRHILHTESDTSMATELDLRTCCQMLQHLRENMKDENEQLYGPNVNQYLRVSMHMQKLIDMRSRR